MKTKASGSSAAYVAGLAVLLCGVSVALELPAPVEVAMIGAALLLVATAGAFLGIAITATRVSKGTLER